MPTPMCTWSAVTPWSVLPRPVHGFAVAAGAAAGAPADTAVSPLLARLVPLPATDDDAAGAVAGAAATPPAAGAPEVAAAVFPPFTASPDVTSPPALST